VVSLADEKERAIGSAEIDKRVSLDVIMEMGKDWCGVVLAGTDSVFKDRVSIFGGEIEEEIL